MVRTFSCALLLGIVGCSHTTESTPHPLQKMERVEISMAFARASSLYDAPVPSDDLVKPDGTLDVSKVPNPDHVALIDQALALLARDARGFALAGAVYFRASGALDAASLPSMKASVEKGASVFLVGIDEHAPDFRKAYPLDVMFMADGGPFGDQNLLIALPLQGTPLRPKTRYAAVVTRNVQDASQLPLSPSSEMAELAGGTKPSDMSAAVFAEYSSALSALAPLVDKADIVALTVFTTDDPAAGVRVVEADALASHPLSALKTAPTLSDVFPDYCVYNSTIDVPVYQSGTPPYSTKGGDWRFDASGKPIFSHTESSRVVFTVPRTAMPTSGFPTVVFVRTGAGGDRPLVDRGKCATQDFTTPIVPGTGPGMYFAKVGFAGVQFDGPLGGSRNPTTQNEDFLIFNVSNAAALRDNVRQSALELALFSHLVSSFSFDVSDCPGASATEPATFDEGHLALMGHSMGAWISPLTLASEPRYGASVLSGAGGSYIANVMDKQLPLNVRPLAELLLGYTTSGRKLDAHDPALTIVQWAAEPSDPQVYDRAIVREPAAGESARHVLMLQGIVDHYILPSIANATSLALTLDQAGAEYDAKSAEEKKDDQTPFVALLPYTGRSEIAFPVSANEVSKAGGKTTAVLVQHLSDGIEDGHEVVFQTDPPKHQYSCFLESFAHGMPKVPKDGAATAACPP